MLFSSPVIFFMTIDHCFSVPLFSLYLFLLIFLLPQTCLRENCMGTIACLYIMTFQLHLPLLIVTESLSQFQLPRENLMGPVLLSDQASLQVSCIGSPLVIYTTSGPTTSSLLHNVSGSVIGVMNGVFPLHKGCEPFLPTLTKCHHWIEVFIYLSTL